MRVKEQYLIDADWRYIKEMEEDARYREEQNLWQMINYAVKHGQLTEEQALEYWKDKEKGFEWMHLSEA